MLPQAFSGTQKHRAGAVEKTLKSCFKTYCMPHDSSHDLESHFRSADDLYFVKGNRLNATERHDQCALSFCLLRSIWLVISLNDMDHVIWEAGALAECGECKNY